MRYLVLICVIALAAFLYMNPETRNAYHSQSHEVYGIDVAHYQHQINWDLVEQDDIRFAYVKATEGEEHVDKYFHQNWAALERSSIKRGAYHFFRPSISAEKQATHFIRTVSLKPGDLPPVLDVEVTGKRSTAEIVEGVATWLEMVEAHYGVRPMIYSGLNFHRKHLANYFPSHDLWIASYSWRSPRLSNGRPWTFWQYTDKGRVKGIQGNVDINTFNGNLFALERLAQGAPLNPFSLPPAFQPPANTASPQGLDLARVWEMGRQVFQANEQATPQARSYERPLRPEKPVSHPPVPRFDSINNPAGVVTRPLRP